MNLEAQFKMCHSLRMVAYATGDRLLQSATDGWESSLTALAAFEQRMPPLDDLQWREVGRLNVRNDQAGIDWRGDEQPIPPMAGAMFVARPVKEIVMAVIPPQNLSTCFAGARAVEHHGSVTLQWGIQAFERSPGEPPVHSRMIFEKSLLRC